MQGSFKAVFKAQISVLKWAGAQFTYQKLPSKKIKKIDGVYDGLLIWCYFIQKKKHFSEIIKQQK
jgi:hypothetical protein